MGTLGGRPKACKSLSVMDDWVGGHQLVWFALGPRDVCLFLSLFKIGENFNNTSDQSVRWSWKRRSRSAVYHFPPKPAPIAPEWEKSVLCLGT